MSRNSETEKTSENNSLITSDPNKKTYIDEHGRKYWLTTGYHGRTIRMYGEPWKFRTTLGDIIAQTLVTVIGAFAIYSLLFGK